MKYVLVEWDDATTSIEDFSEENYVPCITQSVGILVSETEEGIVLATDYVPSMEHYRCKHTIPRGMILSIQSLGTHTR